jgi:outer membrane receptor protein involved in Fe transport
MVSQAVIADLQAMRWPAGNRPRQALGAMHVATALAFGLILASSARGADAPPDTSLTQATASGARDSSAVSERSASPVARDSLTAQAPRDTLVAVPPAAAPPPAPQALPDVAPAAAGAPALPAPPVTPVSAGARGVADTVTLLPPVQVRQTRSATPERSTATTVRLERSGIVRFLPSNVNDALAAVPGVELVKMGPWASRVSLRGLSGDRVLVMVDGVRLNSGRGHGGQTSMISVDRLDAVELMPGASSAQYGSDAIGGVINLVTHRSLFEVHPVMDFTLTARGSEPGDGNAQQLRGRVRASWWGLELGGGVGSLNGLRTPDGPLPNSAYREDNALGRAALQLGPGVLDIEHTHQAAYDVGLPAFNGALGFSTTSGATAVYPLQSRDADRLELSLPSGGARPEARLLGVIQTQRAYFTETSTDSTFAGGRLVRTSRNEANDRVTTHSAGIQPLVRFEGFGGLRLSGEFRDETAGGPRVTDKSPIQYPLFGPPVPQPTVTTAGESVPPARRRVWSGSAFVRPKLAGVRLETGVRYDWVHSHADSTPASKYPESDATDERWSGEAGLSRPLGPVEPYVHVATGFRVPNLDERYYNEEIHGGMRLYGNPDLEPETSRSYEAGVRASDRLAEWLPEARVSFYRSRVENLISFKYVTTINLVPRFQYFNLRDTRIDGVELQSRLRLGALGVALNAGFPRGIDTETGQRILDVGTGRVTVDLTVPAARLLPMGQISARLRWNDAVQPQKVQDQLLARPAFWVASVEASSVVVGVRTVFAVRNLFNTYYLEPLSFIPEGGRTFALSLRKEFSVPLGLGRKGS